MKNKVSILIVLYIVSGFYLACCKKPPSPYYNFNKIYVTNEYLHKGVYHIIGAKFQIELDSIRFISNNNYGLFNETFAFSKCPENGSEGLKDKIAYMNITCNLPYYDSISVGENLFPLFYGLNFSEKQIKDQDLIELLNEEGSFERYGRKLPLIYIKENNIENTKHVFNFEITTASGKMFSDTSVVNHW